MAYVKANKGRIGAAMTAGRDAKADAAKAEAAKADAAKPDAATLAEFPHHLIDLISPEEAYSAARFRRDAMALMATTLPSSAFRSSLPP